MKQKLFLTLTTVVLVVAAFCISSHRLKSYPSSLLSMENIEALSSPEISAVQVLCDNYSYVLICKCQCIKCGTIYSAISAHGRAHNARGICRCGGMAFFY